MDVEDWLLSHCEYYDVGDEKYTRITKDILKDFEFTSSGIATDHSIKVNGEIKYKFKRTEYFLCNCPSLKNSPEICSYFTCSHISSTKYLPLEFDSGVISVNGDFPIYDLRYIFFSKINEFVNIGINNTYNTALSKFFTKNRNPDASKIVELMQRLKAGDIYD